ncbi:DUF1501 domain-containing protein [Prosthecobacter sp.]|jgi:hypothetical protein|uniref:DUF1501 domain-containing protein n=1 Tax=Prosthecobacter sp. TaxID=1965333 RepID=UPI0037845A83
MNTPFSRRHLLSASSAGFGMLALRGLFGAESPLVTKRTHFPARAKRVIFLFMQGGPSQVDTFDFKPALTKQHGKAVKEGSPTVYYQSPWQFRPRGQSGMLVSDLLPNIARHADDLCVINSMHTDHNAHPQAILQMNTGSFAFTRPSVGAWCVHGLGTENQNLPGFITINPEFSGGGPLKHGCAFLPAACAGTPIGHGGGGSATAPPKPLKGIELPFMKNAWLNAEEQRRQLDLVQTLNRQKLAADGSNEALEGLITSAELAFNMQREMPDVMDVTKESPATQGMYGIGDGKPTDQIGRACLMARRFCEAGVRFVQVNHSFWDDHTDIFKGHPEHALETDQPVGALLTDLKQRGLLEDTLVLWGGEFGRPPLLNKNNGRDHNNVGFTMWLAGGGVKPGIKFGSTDETGATAVENKVHLHDLHATMLHLLGLDHEKLTFRYAGRDFRLTDVYGEVKRGIIA